MKPIRPYTPEAHARAWGTELFVAKTRKYLGKVLFMKAGHKGGLQYHRRKDEAFHLLSGQALVRSDDGTGVLITREMSPGESYHIPPGAPHQVEAVTDCVLVEASTPHYDDRVRCEEAYGLTFDGGLQTTR